MEILDFFEKNENEEEFFCKIQIWKKVVAFYGYVINEPWVSSTKRNLNKEKWKFSTFFNKKMKTKKNFFAKLRFEKKLLPSMGIWSMSRGVSSTKTKFEQKNENFRLFLTKKWKQKRIFLQNWDLKKSCCLLWVFDQWAVGFQH